MGSGWRITGPYEFSVLATYNSEIARGIVHTEEWKAQMAAEQRRFDAQPHPADAPRRPWWRWWS